MNANVEVDLRREVVKMGFGKATDVTICINELSRLTRSNRTLYDLTTSWWLYVAHFGDRSVCECGSGKQWAAHSYVND